MTDFVTGEEEDTLQADLAAAFDEIEARGPAEPEAPAPEEAETEETPSDSRARDEHGRFLPKAAPGEGEQPEASTEAPSAPEAPAADDPLGKPPETWRGAAAEKWADIPLEARGEILKREQDVQRAATRWDEDRTFGKSVKDVVAPFAPLIKQLGAEPIQAIQFLLNADAKLRTTGDPAEKHAMFMKLARDYGVDLTNPTPQSDPIQSLQNQVRQLESRLANPQPSSTMTAPNVDHSAIEAEIATFAADPKHSHFDTVRDHMAALLSSGAAKDIADAYDQAVWANPITRALRQAATRTQEEGRLAAERAARAAAAKSAAVSVTGAPGSAVPTRSQPSGSLEEELSRNYDAIVNGRI